MNLTKYGKWKHCTILAAIYHETSVRLRDDCAIIGSAYFQRKSADYYEKARKIMKIKT